MSKTQRHEITEDRRSWRRLVHRADVALSNPRTPRRQLETLDEELGTATRAATAWDASYTLGEAWGEVSDRLGWEG